MNKQEAQKQIEEQRDMILSLRGWAAFGYIKGIINQLDEPPKIEIPKAEFKKSPKVKVPQFVADYIEFKKENNFHVYGAMRVIKDHYDKKVPEWFYEKNIEKFCRAWINGYEVKEKQYIVKVKNIPEKDSALNCDKRTRRFMFSNPEENSLYDTKFTRKELEEAGFGWVFDCEGVEVEEVE